MVVLIILGSLAIAIASYLMVAAKDKSYFNVLTPFYLTFIPAYYILELIYVYYFGSSGDTSSYLFCYATYASICFFMALAYTKFPSYNLKLPFNARTDIGILPYLFLVLSILVYLPVLIEFRDLIFSPRAIYMQTRTGYGHIYFVSTMLTYVGFVLILFKKRTFKSEKVLFFVLSAMLCLLHGSKGQVVTLILMAMMYNVFVADRKVNLRKIVVYLSVFAVSLGSLFYLFSHKVEGEKVGIFEGMATYSDYTRNAIMVIEDDPEPAWGQLTLETAFYSRIPRVLYPDKPKEWGTFRLAKKYYPVWFEKETGAASFGLIGVPFADFGYFSIVYLSMWAVITGILLRMFVVRLKRHKNPSDFIMVLFLCGVSVISAGVGYNLPEHIVLAILLAFVLRLKIVTSSTTVTSLACGTEGRA